MLLCEQTERSKRSSTWLAGGGRDEKKSTGGMTFRLAEALNDKRSADPTRRRFLPNTNLHGAGAPLVGGGFEFGLGRGQSTASIDDNSGCLIRGDQIAAIACMSKVVDQSIQDVEACLDFVEPATQLFA